MGDAFVQEDDENEKGGVTCGEVERSSRLDLKLALSYPPARNEWPKSPEGLRMHFGSNERGPVGTLGGYARSEAVDPLSDSLPSEFGRRLE